jgi:[FeFe] hydrogenase H-cluster maturation GTPase HydF
MLRAHVGIFGRTNVGKSSLINSLAKQDISIVSHQAGTTTDPVKKLIEIEGIGPTQFIDTAGIDDQGELGHQRIDKSLKAIEEIDLGIIVVINNDLNKFERDVIKRFKTLNIPFFFVHHKNDIVPMSTDFKKEIFDEFKAEVIPFSSIGHTTQQLNDLVSYLSSKMPATAHHYKTILGDLIGLKDIILMVTPIDAEAPQGRMILPQVQALRDALEHHAIVVMLRETELEDYFRLFNTYPSLVITDSQAFEYVDSVVPDDVRLTSFSILFARLKGDWRRFYEGTRHLSKLIDGDNILIYESCSHHVLENDIGREKLPAWIKKFTQKRLNFEVVAGKDHPKLELNQYSMVIQCGGCMMTKKQITNRMQDFINLDIPISNYGMAISYCHGIFDRATELFCRE